MSARDDYPKLDANTSGPHHQGQTSTEAQRALDEIDALRLDAVIALDASDRAEAMNAKLIDNLWHLARMSLNGDRRSVELYVHRLAWKYRGTHIGAELAKLDKVPGVALREQP